MGCHALLLTLKTIPAPWEMTVAGNKKSKNWSSRAQVENAAAADRFRAERARALLGAQQARAQAATPKPLSRPGVSVPTILRYATTSEPQQWLGIEAGRAVLDTIVQCAEDGFDRIAFPWPNRIGGGFVSAAISLHEARSRGRLAHATFAYWPWRAGATWAARSILVNPADLLANAQRICTDVRSGAAWADTRLAHEDRAVVELRLRELLNETRCNRGDSDARIVVRSPNLFEITPTFPPSMPASLPYTPQPQHFLYRVHRHTHIRQATAASRLTAVNDPERTPFALFGLPPTTRREELQTYLSAARFARLGLDVVVVDLTQVARQAFPDVWERALTVLVGALDETPGRRPPMAVIAEDAFALKAATKIIRSHNATLVPRRQAPGDVGVYLPRRGVLGPTAALPTDLTPVEFHPDIKDAALAPIRSRLLSVGGELRQQGGVSAASAASRALRFLQRVASLPIGVTEAREIVDTLHPNEDEFDQTARAALRPRMELAGLLTAGHQFPSVAAETQRLATEIEQRFESWRDETPVSAKMRALIASNAWQRADTMIAVSSEFVRELLLSSERALAWSCEIVSPRDLPERLATVRLARLIVVGPSPEVLRTLLTSAYVPLKVILLGDSAGVGLLKSEIWPIANLATFRPLAARATALRAALEEGGGDEQLDVAEAAFRSHNQEAEREVDFTRSGGEYRGDVIHIVTELGSRFAYRTGSDVLVQSPSEVRPFVRKEARLIEPGELILALKDDVRDKLRRALFGSRRIQAALAPYHAYISRKRADVHGTTVTDKARRLVAAMRELDPTVPASEVHNVKRWITSDLALADADGYRMPGTARDWPRFHLFSRSIGMSDTMAQTYWEAVVLPTRAYRVQEGHGFNQHIVQFVLDPEATALGAGVFSRLADLWQLVLGAVESVASITVEHRNGRNGHV